MGQIAFGWWPAKVIAGEDIANEDLLEARESTDNRKGAAKEDSGSFSTMIAKFCVPQQKESKNV